jgi:branched-chain amino acid transport system ATP-binding protein
LKPVLRAESISKSFNHVRVLTSARLSVALAAVTLLAGRNGSGKSTLMKICAGRLAPDQGTIWLGDRMWTRAWLHELAKFGSQVADHVAGGGGPGAVAAGLARG